MKTKVPKKYKILLADFSNSDTGAEIPYLFHRAGCEVHVLCQKQSWLLKNSYVDKWLPDVWAGEKEFAQALQSVVLTGNYDWVVAVDDRALGILKEYITDEVLAKKILPLSKMDNRACLWSKAELSLLCKENNITTPDFIVYDGITDPVLLAERIGYPLVLKIDSSSGGNGVFYCRNANQLTRHWEGIKPEHRRNLVIQKYISGDNIACEALFKDGSLLAYVASKVTQTIEGEFGASMVRVYSARPELEPQLQRLGRVLGINGFGNLTFIYSPQDNKYYLLEADLRPQVWFRMAELAGLDFSMAIKNYLEGNFAVMRANLKGEKVMRSFGREVGFYLNARRRNFAEVLKWAFNVGGRWQFIPSYDKKILMHILVHLGKYCVTESRTRLRLKNYFK